ncbi:translation initiation factor IF-2 [Bacillaceae bacterium SIJ1]|uniref:translation initiation factor IF-2 n=1 Tax=Litoribacterium kuwaitense TaxID=1398745 RepID=UPI0013EC1651|nr:translation initiation factor IF-2 [Litoribacterium kuwaitense]NGP44089.1 translation initiation factor IF-2 [Litoribacterium kuwaitense]
MSKLRVYEYAKKNNLSSKQVIETLKSLNVEVANHMSTIDETVVKKLDEKTKKPQKSTAPATNKQGAKAESQGKAPQQKNRPSNAGQGGNNGKKRGNVKQQGKHRGQAQRPNHSDGNKGKSKAKAKAPVEKKISVSGNMTVGQLAEKMKKEPAELIKQLMQLGIMATINQDVDTDTITLIAEENGFEVEVKEVIDTTDLATHDQEDREEQLEIRPAVVTIMGHVDHGKTTLLDAIRKSKVTDSEAGGITQHIGAYQIEENNKKITFLDTPGHAAFTTMRARGAEVTDITVLVVAADDGVMPQTVEAINHAKAAEVPIIVAVNKMDKPAANPDRVMQELTEHELVPEAWGGETIFVPLSAVNREGIDDLLEMILLMAEVEEYKANPNRRAAGSVIEAELDKGRGPVATLLVQKGTLRIGDALVVGNTSGRVRAMVNDLGRRIKEAGPSTPVEITGLNEVPLAGDPFIVFNDEKTARQVGEARAQKQLDKDRGEKSRISLDDLFEQIKQGEMKELNLIVKADVQGSVEALAASLQKINVEGVKINIIHTGAGAITESDIILASASNAIVIGFNVRPDTNARQTAKLENVDIRQHNVIYRAIEEIEAAMKGLLDPEYEEIVIGQAEVRETFKVSKVGTIAGCYVLEGKISRNAGIRVIRDGVVIFEGHIDTLKRFKDDAKEVSQGYECGITVQKFNDIKEGDIFEVYTMQEVKRA